MLHLHLHLLMKFVDNIQLHYNHLQPLEEVFLIILINPTNVEPRQLKKVIIFSLPYQYELQQLKPFYQLQVVQIEIY